MCETAKLLGITTKLDCYPAEGLGGLTLGVTPLEMAGAYATLARGGIRHRPTGIERVVFPDGKSENLASAKGKRVLTDGEASEVTKVLEMNVQSGTGTAANYGCPAAGKTGTTDEAKDAWFVGYTPELSAAVWVGYPDAGVAMPGAQGGTYAAPVWHAFMTPPTGTSATTSRSQRSPPSSHPSSASTPAPAAQAAASTTRRAPSTHHDDRASTTRASTRGAARRARDRDASRGRRPRRPAPGNGNGNGKKSEPGGTAAPG